MATKKKKKQHHYTSGPAAKQITQAKNWGRVRTVELMLPSGNVALVRRPGLPELLGANIFPDEMSAIINEAFTAAQLRIVGKPVPNPITTEDEFLENIAKNPQKIVEMFEVFDRVLVYAVVAPKVAFHKRPMMSDGSPILDSENREILEVIPEEDRDEDTVYTDMVNEEDKTFIFNFAVGGTSDIARFRQEQAAIVADVSNGKGPELQAEQDPGSEGNI